MLNLKITIISYIARFLLQTQTTFFRPAGVCSCRLFFNTKHKHVLLTFKTMPHLHEQFTKSLTHNCNSAVMFFKSLSTAIATRSSANFGKILCGMSCKYMMNNRGHKFVPAEVPKSDSIHSPKWPLTLSLAKRFVRKLATCSRWMLADVVV